VKGGEAGAAPLETPRQTTHHTRLQTVALLAGTTEGVGSAQLGWKIDLKTLSGILDKRPHMISIQVILSKVVTTKPVTLKTLEHSAKDISHHYL
jgi:hypothetical protein